MEFTTWPILATYAGALGMVLVITQLTKSIGFIKKIPTQLWSYVIALIILYLAHYFTGQLDWSNAVLILFNAAIVALASNGGFEAMNRIYRTVTKTDDQTIDKEG